MSFNEIEFNIEILKSNLKRAPCLCSTIGYNHIIKKAVSNQANGNTDYIARIFGTPEYFSQCYVESLFRTIKHYQIKYRTTRKFKEDLMSPKEDLPTLSEIEVAAKLAPYFKLTPEFPISQSKSRSERPKNLDLLIEDKNTGEKALVEIVTIGYNFESHKDPNGEPDVRYPGGKGSKGNKIKNAIDGKLKGQFEELQNDVKDGKIPLEYPLLVLVNNLGPNYVSLGKVSDQKEIELGLYQKEFTSLDENNKISYRQSGLYQEENIEFITKMGIYELKFCENFRTDRRIYEPFKNFQQTGSSQFQLIFNDHYRTSGRFYKPLKSPQREMSLVFENKLKNVLFDN